LAFGEAKVLFLTIVNDSEEQVKSKRKKETDKERDIESTIKI
jgi:hypothetical protein